MGKTFKTQLFDAQGYLSQKSLIALSTIITALFKIRFNVQGAGEETLLRILGLKEKCIVSFDIKRAPWGFSGGVKRNFRYNYANSILKDLIFYLKKDIFESEYLG